MDEHNVTEIEFIATFSKWVMAKWLDKAVLVYEIPIYYKDMKPQDNLGILKSPNPLTSSSLEGKVVQQKLHVQNVSQSQQKFCQIVLFN